MSENPQPLANVVSSINSLPWNYALFLPKEKPWNEQTPCLILDPDDSDDPDEDPAAAKEQGLHYALSVQDVQSVAANAQSQRDNVDTATLIVAINYYHSNDAYMNLDVDESR